jgi:PEP-CTERM motif
MTIRGSKSLLGMVIAAGVALLAGSASAAPSLTLLGDSATLRVTTYSPTLQVVSPNVGAVYGTSPLPSITTTTSGGLITWKIAFTPSSQFFAAANNAGGGKTVELDGKLDIIFTADSAFTLNNVQVLEDGIWNTTGNGTKSVTGGLVITNQTTSATGGNSFPGATFASSGLWTLSDTVTGAVGTASTAYKLSIDNALIAESLAGTAPGSAYIAKKDFTILITGFVPEPASLGILALGSLALIGRRRKA